MTTEQTKEMEEWCDWACGNYSRSHIKWKAARLGYIQGVYKTEQKLNIHGVTGANTPTELLGNEAMGKAGAVEVIEIKTG